jgi:hypothetical protein
MNKIWLWLYRWTQAKIIFWAMDFADRGILVSDKDLKLKHKIVCRLHSISTRRADFTGEQ